MSGIAPVMREYVAGEISKATAPLVERIAELESKSLHDAGVWRAGVSYAVASVCSDRGSAWVCRTPTMERPGESAHWRLLVKRGRDGRDANEPRSPTKPRSYGA